MGNVRTVGQIVRPACGDVVCLERGLELDSGLTISSYSKGYVMLSKEFSASRCGQLLTATMRDPSRFEGSVPRDEERQAAA